MSVIVAFRLATAGEEAGIFATTTLPQVPAQYEEVWVNGNHFRVTRRQWSISCENETTSAMLTVEKIGDFKVEVNGEMV